VATTQKITGKKKIEKKERRKLKALLGLREKYNRIFEIIDEKATRKIKRRIPNENEKEKKIE
jgi:hypothetical protein